MRKSAQPSPHGFHSSLLHSTFKSNSGVFCSIAPHTPHPRLTRATPTQFVNSHNKSHRLCYALRHRLQRGAKYGTISELAWMKVTEWNHSVSRRLTQPPARLCVSPVWRSPASFSEHHFAEPVQGILLCKHRSWTSKSASPATYF